MTTALTTIDYLQLAAPFLAAPLAAYLSVIGYKSQKRADRGEAFHAEKRRVYHEFLISAAQLAGSISLDSSSQKYKVGREALDELTSSLAVLNLFGSDVVVKAATDFASYFYSLSGKPIDEAVELKNTVREIGEIMRQDLLLSK
ncbi:hypothetical protein [Ruegeria sp. HKCCA0370]|uniref:hypothetical protein n=1 Tax=Ruegeria sp. HKCCA0370 TaxID=2682995 RepID=UPI00148954AA|nr:hypothetical protein [Ruegeria sp. HKCCA0370]